MSTKFYVVSGAGSGIGRAIAFRIAQTSPRHRLVLLGRNLSQLEQVRSELPNAESHRVISMDLRNQRSIAEGIQSARLDRENLVAVIANAGIGGENHYGSDDRWDEIIQTNLSGNYHLIQQCLPALRASADKFRHILIVSSVLARLGVPKYSAYCASKAGLLGLTRSLAAELAPERILVNAICPGWVDTKMAQEGFEDMAKAFGRSVEDVRRTEMEKVPLRKMSAPAEIGAFVEFLVSENQTSITGQTLDINGGAVMV